MPNWCENRLTIQGNKSILKTCVNHIVTTNNDEVAFLDFNRIVPMPDSIKNAVSSNLEYIAKAIYAYRVEGNNDLILNYLDYQWVKELNISNADDLVKVFTNKYEKELYVYFYNKIIHDHYTWYDWSLKNWGCKWNSSNTTLFVFEDQCKAEIMFDTPWCPPEALIKSLSLLYPALEFELAYEETSMDFGGVVTYVNGVISNVVEYSPSERHYDNGDNGVDSDIDQVDASS